MSLLSQSPFFFANTPYVCALWNAGSTHEGELAQVSFLVSNQLEDDADLGKGRERLGRRCFQFLGI